MFCALEFYKSKEIRIKWNYYRINAVTLKIQKLDIRLFQSFAKDDGATIPITSSKMSLLRD